MWRNGTDCECEPDEMASRWRSPQLSARMVSGSRQGIDLCQYWNTRGGNEGSSKLQVDLLHHGDAHMCCCDDGVADDYTVTPWYHHSSSSALVTNTIPVKYVSRKSACPPISPSVRAT